MTRRALADQRVRLEALHRPSASLPPPPLRQRKARVPRTSLNLLPGRLPKTFNDPLHRASAKVGVPQCGETAWLRKVKAMRARGLRRQQKHEAWLKAYKGERCVLATIAMGKSESDYERRLGMLWAFMARFPLSKQPRMRFDEALSECLECPYLVGETCELRDKLTASLAAICPTLTPP